MTLYARDRNLKDDISSTNFKILLLKFISSQLESPLKFMKDLKLTSIVMHKVEYKYVRSQKGEYKHIKLSIK